MQRLKKFIARVLSSWYSHGALKEGAALSFYTILALPPLFIALATLASFIFDISIVEKNLLHSGTFLFGETSTSLIQIALHTVSSTTELTFQNAFNLFVLLAIASGIFWQLQESLNIIFGNQKQKQNFLHFLSNQILLIFVVGILCILFIVATFMDTLFTYFHNIPSPSFSFLGYFMSLVIFWGAVACLFKFLPHKGLSWKHALTGSFITTMLFQIGKYFLVIYISSIHIASTYGAASSVVVILLWVYYSSQTLFLGAECVAPSSKK